MIGKTARTTIRLESLLAFCLGAFLLLVPRASVQSVVMIIGLYLLLDGGLTLISKVAERSVVSAVLAGIAAVIGIVALFNPSWLGYRVIFFLVGWALIHGVVNIGAGISARANGRLAAWLALSGVVLWFLAFWLLTHKGPAAFLLLRWIAIFGLVYGYTLLGLSGEVKDGEKAATEDAASANSRKVA